MKYEKNKNALGVAEDSIRTKFVIIIFAGPTFGAWRSVNWTGLCMQSFVCKLAEDAKNKTSPTEK